MKVTLFGLLLSVLAVNLQAQTKNTAIFRFLEVSPDAASAALGGAHPGLFSGDYSAFHLNPAYLAKGATGDVSATFADYFADSRMGFLNGAARLDSVQTLGFGVRYMGYGDFSALDEEGNNLGNIHVMDLALGAVYAYKITDNWSAGGELNYILSSYGQYKSGGVAASGGLYFRDVANHFSFGLAVKNIGTQITTYNGVKEALPVDVAVGISKKPEHFPAELTFSMRQLNNWDMRRYGEKNRPGTADNIARHVLAGAQLFLGENFVIRLGYNHYLNEMNRLRENFDFAGTSLGIGLKIRGLHVDMSRASYSKSGGIFMLSLKTNFRDKWL